MATRGKKIVEAANEVIGQEAPMEIGSIGETQPIERVAENDFSEVAKLERFMHEELTVIVHPDQMEGSLDIITIPVNGTNQNIIRGREQRVKRKYIEALARTRTTVYDQRVQNPAEPANIQMVPRTTLTYPFSVLADPSANGREWLQAILAEK